jgi:hypothetical protein
VRGGRGLLLAAAVALPAGCGGDDERREPSRPSADAITAAGPSARLSERSIRPGEGIGPISLGDSRRAVEEALGPAQAPGSTGQLSWKVGSGRLEARFDVRGRVVEVSTSSDAFDLAGTRLSAGFRGVARALPSWKTLDCGQFESVVLNRGADGPGTAWTFTPQGNFVVVQGQGPIRAECGGE